MKIAITGGNGFIGKKFISIYGDYFKSITVFLRPKSTYEGSKSEKIVPLYIDLSDAKALENELSEIECLIHCAYDSKNIYENYRMAQALIAASKKCNLEKLIYISSFSVYDFSTVPLLNEYSRRHVQGEPYANVKIDLEERFKKAADKNFNVAILQPSIVVGIGGGWSNHRDWVIQNHSSISLPSSGVHTCETIDVKEVAHAIFLACKNFDRIDFSRANYSAFLVSGDSSDTWCDFYMSRAFELGLPLEIYPSENMSGIHPSPFFSRLLSWFSTSFGVFLFSMFQSLKRIKGVGQEPNPCVCADRNKTWEPRLFSRLVHNSRFRIDSSKAKNQLEF